MIDQSTPKGRIVGAALKLAGERPWAAITLRDIAAAAGVTLLEMRAAFAAKTDILAAFMRAVDDEVLRRAPAAGAGQAARDTLFEVVMSRFDVLAPYKPALRSIATGVTFDPQLARPLLASQHWMLHAAGVASDGLAGAVRVAGLASVYGSVFRVWLADEDPGLARTMAALDRRLRRGERTMARLDELCATARRLACAVSGRRSAPPEPTPPAQPGSHPAAL